MSRFHNWNAEMDAASPRVAAIRAEASGEAPDDRPDPHGWAAIHTQIRAERANTRKG